MNLLLTNDDGYQAPGLIMLKQTLERQHTVYCVAPMNQKSGAGHSIHLFKPLDFLKIDDRAYAVDGSPVDCVKAGLFGFFPNIRFDITLSGINDSHNMGNDIYYSGTVAGAREAAIMGGFGIALSVDLNGKPPLFEAIADFTERFLEHLGAVCACEKAYLNINFPSEYPFKGVRITHPGYRRYHDYAIIENGVRPTITIGGDNPTFEPVAGSDLDTVSDGFVSVTILNQNYNQATHFNDTKKRLLKVLSDHFEQWDFQSNARK